MLKRFSHRLAKIWYRNKFDSAWYLERYQDVADAKIDPLKHYIECGRREGRYISHEEEQKAFEKSKDYQKLKESVLFDSKYYAENYGVKTDPVHHYLTEGYKLGFNPSMEFDTERYLSEYPDIYSVGMNPLVHFELCGRQEGRKALPVIPPVEYSGMENNGKKLLLFSHELSLTGAPIALLNAAKLLREIGEHVTVFSPKSGPLEEELKEAGIEYFVEPKCIVKLGRRDENLLAFLDSFKLILFNTIDTLRYASYLHPHTPKVMWVHEGAFGYECLQHNVNAHEAFEYMDKVYSVGNYSKSYTDKYIPEEKSGILLYGVQDIAGDQIQQAGRNEEKLTFGIFGVCNERKGTHLFIDAISRLPNHIKSSCIFKVVGKLEETDFCNEIQEKGLNDGVIFTGELTHDETLREMATVDVVVCPSLDDPMPIVCTEAMQLHKTVIASDHTGTAAFIEHGKNGFICQVDEQRGESNLQSVLEEVYAARTLLKEIGDAAYDIYASNFTMKKFKETLASFLNEEWLKINDKEKL